jgi:hypothetical protein
MYVLLKYIISPMCNNLFLGNKKMNKNAELQIRVYIVLAFILVILNQFTAEHGSVSTFSENSRDVERIKMQN